jgi:hypothetical protein
MRTPPIVARVPLPNAVAVAAHRGFAFVVCKQDGVFGVDLSNPSAPAVLGVLKGEGMDARRAVVDRDVLYVAGFNGGLYVYDIRDPKHPIETARLVSDAIPLVSNLCVWNGFVLLAGADASNARFAVVDARDIRAPRVIGVYAHVAPERSTYESVAYDGRWVLVGTGAGQLHFFNASNPANIVLVSEHATKGTELQPPSLWGIVATQGRAYLASWGAGMIVLDYMNPLIPRELGTVRDGTVGANTYDLELDGHVAYVANGWGGVQGVDVSNPTMPQLLWDVEPERSSYLDVAVSGPLVLAANNGVPQGLDVIKVR